MDKLEEYLPGIEKYLRTTLAKESLSKLAEQQRLYYVERLDVIQLPPHRPPKPGDVEKSQMQGRKLPEPGRNKSNEDFIAHQRAISRQTLSTGEPQAITCEDNPVPNNGLGIDSDQYDEGLYEEPVPMEDNNPSGSYNQLPSAPPVSVDIDSDANSSTSYESYDEPDVEETYNNVGYDGQVKSDIPLPRLKTKRKKKVQSIHERYYKQLQVITYEGELYHRGKLSWAKRYCAICDGILYCYKDKDSKPVLGISLLGYDVVLQEKEKGRANVLRLAKPGCETQFISTDSASETQAWLNKVEPLCYATSGGTPEDSKSTDRTGSVSSMELYTEGPSSSMVNGSPGGKNRKVASTLSSDGKRDKKGTKMGKFWTFGKRKGRSAAQQLQIVTGETLLDRNALASPDITMTGVVKLSSLTFFNDEAWQYKNCAIRNGVFECYKDDSTSSDLDFSLSLPECELRSENSKDKDSLSLAVTKQGETVFIMEPEDKLDQGDWLSALLKHIGNEGLPGPECQELEDITYTYVDSRSLASLPSDTVEVNSLHLSLNDQSPDERQYADLSDHHSEAGGSGVGEGDAYDEPPVETDRQSKVYEEVAETVSPTSSVPDSQRSSIGSAMIHQTAQEPTSQPTIVQENLTDKQKKQSTTPPPPVEEMDKETDRQTRTDLKTNADIIDSPSLSNEVNRPSFSRESSCSSEGSSRRLSENIAKSRAKFESNATNPDGSVGKWSGYKLAGANNSTSTVKRTPSIGSTTSTKSTPNSAASSPKNPRASVLCSGTVDRFKNAFEARESNNNTIIDKTAAPTKSHTDSLRPFHQKPSDSISPIKASVERGVNEPPKFVSVFTPPATAAGSKPKKLEIKSVTPAPYISDSGKVVETNKLDFDSSLKFDIDISSKDGPVAFTTADSFSPRKASTLPASTPVRAVGVQRNASLSASPGSTASRANAKTFLTSALQRFADDNTGRSKMSAVDTETSFVPSFSNEEDEQTRLDTLRQKLINLRKERTKVRDQKRSTVLQADIDRLSASYKKVDEDYKTTHKQIEILENRKLQRIKEMRRDSIERRRLESENNSVSGKKKIWESSS